MSFSVSTQSTASVSTATTVADAPKKLFMEISSATEQEELKALLEYHFGRTVHMHVHTNQYGRTMAFVTFRYHEHAARALQELQGYRLDGLVLHPQWATPRKKVVKKAPPSSITTVKKASVESEKDQWQTVSSKRSTKQRQKKA